MIRVHEVPIPQPGSQEIVIQLFTAGVGGWGESIRDGSWRPSGRPKVPLILGTDGAGIVVRKGARVRRFHVGDRAYAFAAANAKGGFYAEYVVLNQSEAAPVPHGINLLQAGAGAVTGLTAFQGIDSWQPHRAALSAAWCEGSGRIP